MFFLYNWCNQFGAISSSSNRFENFTPFSPTAKTAGDTQTGVMTKSDGHSLISLVELKKGYNFTASPNFFFSPKMKKRLLKIAIFGGKTGDGGAALPFSVSPYPSYKNVNDSRKSAKGHARSAPSKSEFESRVYLAENTDVVTFNWALKIFILHQL